MFEHYIRSGQRWLRCGYTTGTCAALAAAGAATALLTGTVPATMGLRTPKGLFVEVPLRDCRVEGGTARCAVVKDGGDDPDVTDGLSVYAHVRKTGQGVAIDGGPGVGRVTKPGLDQPVGAAAINRVPREMISAAVEAVCASAGYTGGLAESSRLRLGSAYEEGLNSSEQARLGKKAELKELAFDPAQCARDVALYRSLGAASVTQFATWLNGNYVRQYGVTDELFRGYGKAFE